MFVSWGRFNKVFIVGFDVLGLFGECDEKFCLLFIWRKCLSIW